MPDPKSLEGQTSHMPDVTVRPGLEARARRDGSADGGLARAQHGGLTTAEAAERRQRDGPNTLPQPPAMPAWRVLAGQLFHFFAMLLWCAAGLAFIAGMPQLTVAIVAIIVVNALFAFAQEHRAERAAEHLRDLLPRATTVIRDGEPATVDARDLVVGDLMVLASGDRISADAQTVEAHALTVDTSTLTGESVPVAVAVDQELLAGTLPATVDSINIPTCTTGEIRGLVEVPVAAEQGDFDLATSDCTSTSPTPVSDADGFANGYVTESAVPVG